MSLRFLLSIVASPGFHRLQIDVKSAIVNSTLEEDIYTKQPEGFEDNSRHGWVYRLHKAFLA